MLDIPKKLITVFVKPKEFFNDDLATKSKIMTFIVTYITGIILTVDKLERKMASGSFVGKTSVLVEDWIYYWGLILVVSFVSIIWYWFLGGWWYKKRLQWSKIENVNPYDARILYVYSHFTFSFPLLCVYVVNTFIYSSPLLAYNNDLVSPIVFIVSSLFSYSISYRGVKAKYHLTNKLVKFWFLIMPVLFSSIFIGLIVKSYF